MFSRDNNSQNILHQLYTTNSTLSLFVTNKKIDKSFIQYIFNTIRLSVQRGLQLTSAI